MHKTIIVTVGLLLLSVAALPATASGEEAGRAGGATWTVGAPGIATGGGAALVSATPGTSAIPARRGRLLALPGVDSVGLPLLVALGALLGILVVLGALLFGRARRPRTDRPSARSGREQAEGTGVPATTPPKRDRDEGGPSTIQTDEEYVVQLLIANHGRMKQARIVEETDWSKAKVSRLLSRMEEHDQVVRERDGREKIVQLADANTSVPL